MLKGAKILVTGGAGFLGSHLVERLGREGALVRATVHAHPAVVNDVGVEYLQADLTNADDCRRAVEGMDFVFHCAAATSGAAVIANAPLTHVTPNLVMTALLMEAAHAAKVRRLLLVGSSVAYPPTGARPVRESELFGGDPSDVYFGAGWTKRTAEWLAVLYAQKLSPPMPTVVVRPTNIYGPRDKFDPRTSHVTAALIRRVAERQAPMTIWGTGDDVRDLLHVDDAIDGMLLAFEKCDRHLAVNLAAGEGHSVKAVLALLCELDGFADADIRFDASRPRMTPVRLVDVTLARDELGFTPRITLREGLARTLAWYRREGGAWTR